MKALGYVLAVLAGPWGHSRCLQIHLSQLQWPQDRLWLWRGSTHISPSRVSQSCSQTQLGEKAWLTDFCILHSFALQVPSTLICICSWQTELLYCVKKKNTNNLIDCIFFSASGWHGGTARRPRPPLCSSDPSQESAYKKERWHFCVKLAQYLSHNKVKKQKKPPHKATKEASSEEQKNKDGWAHARRHVYCLHYKSTGRYAALVTSKSLEAIILLLKSFRLIKRTKFAVLRLVRPDLPQPRAWLHAQAVEGSSYLEERCEHSPSTSLLTKQESATLTPWTWMYLKDCRRLSPRGLTHLPGAFSNLQLPFSSLQIASRQEHKQQEE